MGESTLMAEVRIEIEMMLELGTAALKKGQVAATKAAQHSLMEVGSSWLQTQQVCIRLEALTRAVKDLKP